MKPKTKKNILTDTFETFAEAGKHIGKDTAKGVASVADINAFLYGATPEKTDKNTHEKNQKLIKEYGVDNKTKEENEKMEANHTPLDVQALRDKQQMEQIKKRLFDFQKSEEQKAEKSMEETDKKRKQAEQEEEEKKKREEEEKKKQLPPEDAHGKQKGKLGQPKKKASTDPHQNFEQKANRGK